MLKIYEFDVLKDMEFFLQGGVSGGKVVVGQSGVISGLHNKTLIFTTPLVTVTLSDPTGAGLTPKAITTQVNTANNTILVFWRDGRMHLLRTAGAVAGVVLAHTGTANSFFGFSSASDGVGTFINGPTGAVPRLLETNNKSRLDGYYAVVEV